MTLRSIACGTQTRWNPNSLAAVSFRAPSARTPPTVHYFRAGAMQGEWGEDRGLGSSSGSGACLHYERYVHHLRSILSLTMIFVSSDVTTKHRTKETGIYFPHPGQHQKPKPHQLRAENNSNQDALIWTYGPMDKAPVYGTGDSRFDPW